MTIEQKVKILINDLRESQDTRVQNFISLTEHEGKKITTYCALGALGCVKRLIYYSDTRTRVIVPGNSTIIEAYGISNNLTKTIILPLLYKREGKNDVILRTINYLSDLIICCNDGGHFKFVEIADYIETLLGNGYFQECTEEATQSALKEQRKLTNDEIQEQYNNMPDIRA